MATTVPATADNCGRLIGYTWGELRSRTWGNLHQIPYGVQQSVKAMNNAGTAFNNRAAALNNQLEKSNMYQLSSIETAFGFVESALDALNRNLG